MQFRSARFVRLRLFVVPVLLAALAPALPAVAQDVPGDFGIFLPVDAAGSDVVGLAARSLAGDDPIVVRVRRVGIDFEAFAPLTNVLDRGAAFPVLRLNLFENVVVESLVESVDLTASGYSWSGGVADDPMGSVAVAVNGDVVSGVVRTRGRVYMIRSEGSGQYSIREVDRSGLPEGAPPLVPRSLVETDPAPAAFVDDPGRVDIAVFYTPAAQRDAGGTDEINALIDAWIADTNGAYLRSNIQHRLNLVLREQVSYTEGEDSEEFDESVVGQALDCLTEADDECLDAVHARREKYSADLVHLIVGGPFPLGVCGRAWRPGDLGVSHLDCGSDTFAHEIGHNSGANHDRYVEYNEECDTDTETPCFTDVPSAYAYGYVNQLGLNAGARREHRWITVMAYDEQCSEADVYCPRVMRFSNPDQSWQGDRLGVSGTTSRSSYSDAAEAARVGPADAARTHREFAHDLANRVVREAPDLVVKGLQANRLQAVPGALVRLSAVVENLGISTGYAPETAVTWCRASQSGCSSSVGVPAAVSYLESNGRAPVSTSFTLPSSQGSYSYRACVSSTWGETLTENNCSETVTVEVGVVDLQFSMSLSTYSALAGAEVTITGVAHNRGTLPAHASQMHFVTLDSAGELDWFDSHFFQTLAAGSSATFETTVEAPSVAGDYPYAACLTSSHVEFSCVEENLSVVSSSTPTPTPTPTTTTTPTPSADYEIVNVRRYLSVINTADWLKFTWRAHTAATSFAVTVQFQQGAFFSSCTEYLFNPVVGQQEDELTIPSVCGTDEQWSSVTIQPADGRTCDGCGTFARETLPIDPSLLTLESADPAEITTLIEERAAAR